MRTSMIKATRSGEVGTAVELSCTFVDGMLMLSHIVESLGKNVDMSGTEVAKMLHSIMEDVDSEKGGK